MADSLDSLGITRLKEIAREEGVSRYTTFNSSTKHELVRLIREKRQSVAGRMVQVTPGPQTVPGFTVIQMRDILTESLPDMAKIAEVFRQVKPTDVGVYLGEGESYIDLILKYQYDPRVLEYAFSVEQIPINKQGKNGNTMLHIAAAYGNQNAVRILLERGANPNILNRKLKGPLLESLNLHIAGRSEPLYQPETSIRLLQAGADPNQRDIEDNYPLLQAIVTSNREVINFMLQNTHLNVSPEADHLIISGEFAVDNVLLQDPRFVRVLFERGSYAGTRSTTYLTYKSQGGARETISTREEIMSQMGEVIRETKRTITEGILTNPRAELSLIERVSVIDTVLDSFRLLREGEGNRKLIVPIFFGDLDQLRAELTVETENLEEVEFFKFPVDIPMNGSVHSYAVPYYIKTWRQLADSFGPVANYLDFVLEGEIVNDSDIEIEDGQVIEIQVKPALAGFGRA